MDLIESYSGNEKRYHSYLNGACDFFIFKILKINLT